LQGNFEDWTKNKALIKGYLSTRLGEPE